MVMIIITRLSIKHVSVMSFEILSVFPYFVGKTFFYEYSYRQTDTRKDFLRKLCMDFPPPFLGYMSKKHYICNRNIEERKLS